MLTLIIHHVAVRSWWVNPSSVLWFLPIFLILKSITTLCFSVYQVLATLTTLLLSLKTMSVLLWICSSKPGSISSYGRSQLAIMIILMMMMMIIFMMINQRCLSLVMLQTKLVAGTTNITTLYLSADSLEVCFLATCYWFVFPSPTLVYMNVFLFVFCCCDHIINQTLHFCCKSMLVFNNLLNLSIESDKEKGWQVMPVLLKSCPRLHTLVIKVLSIFLLWFFLVVVAHYAFKKLVYGFRDLCTELQISVEMHALAFR